MWRHINWALCLRCFGLLSQCSILLVPFNRFSQGSFSNAKPFNQTWDPFSGSWTWRRTWSPWRRRQATWWDNLSGCFTWNFKITCKGVSLGSFKKVVNICFDALFSTPCRRIQPRPGGFPHPGVMRKQEKVHQHPQKYICCWLVLSSPSSLTRPSLSERSYDLLILYREHSSEEHKIKKILPQRFYVFLSIFYTTPKMNIDIQFP